MNPIRSDRRKVRLLFPLIVAGLVGIFASIVDQGYDEGFTWSLLIPAAGTLLFMGAALFIFARYIYKPPPQ